MIALSFVKPFPPLNNIITNYLPVLFFIGLPTFISRDPINNKDKNFKIKDSLKPFSVTLQKIKSEKNEIYFMRDKECFPILKKGTI
jgi:hypothetical protein